MTESVVEPLLYLHYLFLLAPPLLKLNVSGRLVGPNKMESADDDTDTSERDRLNCGRQ